MVVSVFIILLNILFFFIYKSFNKGDNDYSKEKNRFNRLRLKYIFRYINIGYLIIYLIHLILILLNVGVTNIEYYYIYLILFLLDIISYIFLEYLTKNRKQKFKIIDKKILDNRSILLIISTYILFIIEKVTFNYKEVGDNAQKIHNFLINYHLILRVLCVLIILYSFRYIINIIVNNKELCRYTYNNDDYLEDAKFYSKIDIKKGFNQFIYIAAYIIFFYINIPFIYIFYILVVLILIYLISRKIKKIAFESDKLYKTISFTGEQPGIVYAFQFVRDMLLLKKMIIFTIMLVFSTITYYGLGESIFSYTSISIYLILL